MNSDEEPDYLERLSQVIDIDQWLHFLAVDSLIGNREGGLTTGKGDDYALYRGEKDQRFQLVPHDLGGQELICRRLQPLKRLHGTVRIHNYKLGLGR